MTNEHPGDSAKGLAVTARAGQGRIAATAKGREACIHYLSSWVIA